MKADRGTRITIETERILILARLQAIRGWCEECGAEVEPLPEKEAANIIQRVSKEHPAKSERRLHLEHAKRGLAVCLRSMLLFVRAASRR